MPASQQGFDVPKSLQLAVCSSWLRMLQHSLDGRCVTDPYPGGHDVWSQTDLFIWVRLPKLETYAPGTEANVFLDTDHVPQPQTPWHPETW